MKAQNEIHMLQFGEDADIIYNRNGCEFLFYKT